MMSKKFKPMYLAMAMMAFGTFLMSCSTPNEFMRTEGASATLQVTGIDSNGDGQADGIDITEVPLVEPTATPTPFYTDFTPTPAPGPTSTPTPFCCFPTPTPTRTPTPTATPTNTPTPKPWMTPTATPTVPGGNGTPTPTPTPPNGEGTPTPTPTPNEVEEFCVNMVVTHLGVSSAEIDLNGIPVFTGHDFHNEKVETTIRRQVTLELGTNQLELSATLRGSPGDYMRVQVYACEDTTELNVLFDKTYFRTTGKPQETSDSFSVGP